MGAKDSRLDLLQYQAGRTKAGETSSPEPPLPGSLEASHAWSRARRDSFLSIKHRPMRTGRSAGKTLRVTDGEQTGAATGRRGGGRGDVTRSARPPSPPPRPQGSRLSQPPHCSSGGCVSAGPGFQELPPRLRPTRFARRLVSFSTTV